MSIIILGFAFGFFGLIILMTMDTGIPSAGEFFEMLFPVSLLTGFAGLVLGLLVAMVIGALLPRETYRSDWIDIVALQDNDGVQGRFFLGSGTIGSEMYYYYYYECGKNCYKFGKANAATASIIEGSDIKPHIELFSERFTEDWMNSIGIKPITRGRLEFHIPTGSLKQGFAVDLQ